MASSAHGVRRVPAVLLCCLVALVLAMAVSAGVVPCASNTLSSLEPCLTAVTGRTPQSPTEECCRVIRSTEPTCLCSAVSAYEKYPAVDVPQALLLPKTCGRLIPAGFTCNGQRYLTPTSSITCTILSIYLSILVCPLDMSGTITNHHCQTLNLSNMHPFLLTPAMVTVLFHLLDPSHVQYVCQLGTLSRFV